MCRNKDQKWQFVYQHFHNFVKGQCTFGEVNVDLCKKFREYLLHAKQLKRSSRSISLNSASGYYSTFRGLLKIAYRDKWLRENINDYLDKIEPQEVKKEYLTLDEVKQLAATPCDIPVLKAASLFACLTGLRISDIQNLQWEDFDIAPDQGYCLRIRTQKTQTEATLPISNEAYELCGTPGTGKVFKGLKRSMINYPLKNWLKKAGITKPITFHGFRHSYVLYGAAGTICGIIVLPLPKRMNEPNGKDSYYRRRRTVAQAAGPHHRSGRLRGGRGRRLCRGAQDAPPL